MDVANTYEALQWVGVVSLAAIVFTGVLPLMGKPFDPSRSVSQSWGETEQFHLFMGAVLTIAGAGFCAFVPGWLMPVYHLPAFMYVVTVLAYLAVLAVAWAPITEKPGEHSLRHPHFVEGRRPRSSSRCAMLQFCWRVRTCSRSGMG
jgi:hypothetical protein